MGLSKRTSELDVGMIDMVAVLIVEEKTTRIALERK